MRSAESAIAFEPLEPVGAKGKVKPIPCGASVQARSRVGEPETATRTPFVGREHERAVLLETFLRVERESAPQLVTVVGEPGVGKSRLVAELRSTLDDRPEVVGWRHGRCLPYGEGITFWALGEVVKAEAGILESDDQVEAAAKLEQAVAALVGRSVRAGVVRRPGSHRSQASTSRGSRRTRRSLHGVAPVPRGDGGQASARLRRRGPALGGRSAAGLPRAPRRLGGARPARRARDGTARAVRPPAGLERRQAQRDHDRALTALLGGDGAAPAGASRAGAVAGGDPGFLSSGQAATRSTRSSSRACWPSGAKAASSCSRKRCRR